MNNVPWWLWAIILVEVFGILAYVLRRAFGSSPYPSMNIDQIQNLGPTRVEADWLAKFPYTENE